MNTFLDNSRFSFSVYVQQMHEEVSETENIRQNLAIERMIIGGCDILLDINQGECAPPPPANGGRRLS